MSLIPIDIEAELQRISLVMAGASTGSSSTAAGGSGAGVNNQSSMTLEKRKSYVFVRNTTIEGFTRYPCKLKDHVPGEIFVRFEKVPPVVSDGYIWIPSFKSFFKVTSREICKGIIYVTNSKQYTPTSSECRSRKSILSVESGQPTDNSGERIDGTGSDLVESQILEDADRAFSDQIGTLLNVLTEEDNAEWEIED